ncbi:MAG: lysylphosphatidylglycerol synthase transmembrane domain-containing protein, partial [bacterium]|nr:lysylphosphatidylglycerol synthase transmembrane domain-containing protein [bacterium]
LFFLLGLLLFAFLVYRLGPALLWDQFKKIGFQFVWILLLSGAWFLLYAAAWDIFLREVSKRVHFWIVFRLRVCGETISHLTPLSWGGGDPFRIYLIKEHIPLDEGTASVVVDRTLNNFATALILMGGIFLTLLLFPLDNSLRIGLGVFWILLILGILFFYLRSKEGLFEFGLDLLKKVRIKKNFSEKTLEGVRKVDRHIAQFYQRSHGAFFLAFSLHLVGRLAGVFEIFLAAYFLDFPLSLLEAYLLTVMTIVLNMVFIFVPGNMGVLEGAYAAVFGLLGKDPVAGAAIQIVRRLRMVFWVFIGFLFLSTLPSSQKNHSVEGSV